MHTIFVRELDETILHALDLQPNEEIQIHPTMLLEDIAVTARLFESKREARERNFAGPCLHGLHLYGAFNKGMPRSVWIWETQVTNSKFSERKTWDKFWQDFDIMWRPPLLMEIK